MVEAAESMDSLLQTASNNVKSRCNDALDHVKMGGEILKLLEQENQTVKEIYQTIVKYSEAMQAKKKGYRHNTYQCYIAAKLAAGETKVTVCILGAG